MAAGDKYINQERSHLTSDQVARSLIREDANGKPFVKTNFIPIPLCASITGLTTSNLTSNSVNLEWNNNSEVLFDIYYGLTPLTAPNSGTTPTTTSVVNSKSITGLSSGLTYSFYVRSSCGSSWSGPVTVLTLNNPTVQTYLNKATSDGYTLPTQPKIDTYNAAWDYADANSLTAEFDLVGLLKVENQNLCNIPFIHSGGSAKRFTLVSSPVFTANKGLKSNGVGYLNTNWIASTDHVKFQLNSSGIGVSTDYTLANDNYAMGVLGAGGVILIRPKLVSGSAVVTIQVAGVTISAVDVPSPSGFTSGDLNVDGEINGYKNGVLKATDFGSTGLPTASFYVCCRYNQNIDAAQLFYPGDIQFFYTGSKNINQNKLNTFVNMLLL